MLKKKFIILLCLLPAFLGFSQKSSNLIDHYQNEYQTFKEFIKYGSIIKGDTNIDVQFYYIDIKIGIPSPWIEGEVTIRFEALQNNLDLINISLNSSLTVDNVSGQADGFYQDNDVIVINLDQAYPQGEIIEILITYHGVPVMAGGYKGLRYETHGNNEPIIATLSTPYLAHYWYPCKDGPQDKPDSVFMDITLPDTVINGQGVMGISNGLLENIIDNGDTKTFQWRHRYPIVTYYVMAAVSNYVLYEDEFIGTSGESFPLDYYVFQESLPNIPSGVEELPDVIQFFSDVFGPYPFANEKYGMTELGFYGAIENQTNTIQNNLSIGWFGTSVHELGHMWFGDMITLANWHHGWLNEGFATYSEALWDEHLNGFEAYKNHMATNEFWNGGTLYLQNASDTFNTFQSIFYSKGAYAVHMLRGLMGDDVFFDALLDYSKNPEFMYKNASTEDLQASLENSSGLDLAYFFEQWIYDEYWPFYYYNFAQNSNNNLAIVIYQAQEELYNYRPVFTMPLQIRVNFANGGDSLLTVWNDQQTQTFYFDLEEEVSSIVIDPDKWILRKTLYNPNLPVSVQSATMDEKLMIYPIPFTEKLVIEVMGEGDNDMFVRILNVEGKVVTSLGIKRIEEKCQAIWKGKNSAGIEVEPGIYFIEVTSGKNSYIRKVVKSRY
ncbi:MAG: T9SS type A sorting domain-containing protein [Bacteroidales bacterium]|nr:T9SS type A sorting domain-containing protein [Bacteroidales bacterium]MCF8405088.1 T9SS type A sorting domain-containing protein [Bacteroidales bacterium]